MEKIGANNSEMADALRAQDALQDILRVMNEYPGELAVILDVILEKALRLCHAPFGVVFLYDSGFYEAVCRRGLPKAHDEWFRSLAASRQQPRVALDS